MQSLNTYILNLTHHFLDVIMPMSYDILLTAEDVNTAIYK